MLGQAQNGLSQTDSPAQPSASPAAATSRAILYTCFPRTPARPQLAAGGSPDLTADTEQQQWQLPLQGLGLAANSSPISGRTGTNGDTPAAAAVNGFHSSPAAAATAAPATPAAAGGGTTPPGAPLPASAASPAAAAAAAGAAGQDAGGDLEMVPVTPKGQQVYLLQDPGTIDMGGGMVLHVPLLYDDLALTGAVPRMEDVALPDDLLRNALNSSHPAAFAALTASAEARRAARQEFLSLPKKFLLASDVPGDGVVLREALHLEVKPPLYRRVKRGAGQADRDGGQSQGAGEGSEAGPGSRKRPGTPSMDGMPAYKRLQLLSSEALLPALGDDLVPPSDPVSDMLRAILAGPGSGEELGAADAEELRSPGAMAAVVAQAQQLLAAVAKEDALGQELLAVDKLQADSRVLVARAAAHDPRLRARLEDALLRREWASLARRDVPRGARVLAARRLAAMAAGGRHADAAVREIRVRAARALKEAGRGAGPTMRRLVRDMMAWWRKANKEAVEAARNQERVAVEQRRREEALREERRQKQRLNFLLTQTELYSHFMQNKMGGAAGAGAEGAPDEAEGDAAAAAGAGAGGDAWPAPGGQRLTGGPVVRLQLADDEEQQAALAAQAAAKAQAAVASTLGAAAAFDQEYHKGAVEAGASAPVAKPSKAAAAAARPSHPPAAAAAAAAPGGGEPDLTAPSTMPDSSSVAPPPGFKGTLKHYQLKGMQWLVNLYDQGLNGILADEMGLGKTVQALAFLGYLAQERGIWGPFLVITPASTLHNWDNELHTFCPFFKVLPYWGAAGDRKALRRNFAPRRLYGRAAPFHVAVTSYQIAVQDEAVLKKVKWQYMVLDEAQAIKSSGSQRWRALLSFGCRNRLLLSGTPIQNNLGELWALLHFIMPQLFDSLDAFNEWFSKDVEGAAATSSPAAFVDPQQLARLHAVLTPFMLRRVKADVVAEMVPKTEVMVECKLSRRQRALYRALRNKVNLRELLTSSSSKLNSSLMNLVVQLRKVCSHPELFEAQPERHPYLFAPSVTTASPVMVAPGAVTGVLPRVTPSGANSHLVVQLPKVVYREGCVALPSAVLGGHLEGARSKWLRHVLNPLSTTNVADHLQAYAVNSSSSSSGWGHRGTPSAPASSSAAAEGRPAADAGTSSSSIRGSRWPGPEPCLGFQTGFSFSRLCDLSPGEVHGLAVADPYQRWEAGLVGNTAGGGTRHQQLQLAALWQQYGWQQQQQEAAGVRLASMPAPEQQPGVAGASSSSSSSSSRGGLRRTANMLVIVDDLGLPATHASSSSSSSRWSRCRGWVCRNSQSPDHAPGDSFHAPGSSSSNRSSSSSTAADDSWRWGFSSSSSLLWNLPEQPEDSSNRSSSSSSATSGTMPALVMTSSQWVDRLGPVLRCCWGAVIPVHAPPPQLVCSDRGLELQLAALAGSPWCHQLLWGVNSRPRAPTFPAGTPPLLQHVTTRRLAAAANNATLAAWPAAAAAAIATDEASRAAAAAAAASAAAAVVAAKGAAARAAAEEFAAQQEAVAAAAAARPPLHPVPPFPHPYHLPSPSSPAAGGSAVPTAAAAAAAAGRGGMEWPPLEPSQPLLPPLAEALGSAGPPMQSYALAKALTDSGKLLALDQLLGQLKAEGHRVLIFCQMTQMMNLLEDYLTFRRHRHLRLDGSTTIAERRDMVAAFQSNPGIFVFLLSTRAGGLGINLTAADVVIFYESDWNPTMDLQAMDRCHRLGQTKPVTVYRLVTKGTIEARILQRAGQKRQVQALVMAEGGPAGAAGAGGAGEGAGTAGAAAAADAGADMEPEDVAALLREEAGAWDED